MDKISELLSESVGHWRRVVDGLDIADSDSCPLCNYFDDDCENCPIQKDSNANGCSNTPYKKLIKYIHNSTYFQLYGNLKVFDDESIQYAIDMLEYLIRLLEKEQIDNRASEVYTIGDVFVDERDDELFILSLLSATEKIVGLVSLMDGELWEASHKIIVEQAAGITFTELNCTLVSFENFKKVGEISSLTKSLNTIYNVEY